MIKRQFKILIKSIFVVSNILLTACSHTFSAETMHADEKILIISRFPLAFTPFHDALKEIPADNVILFGSNRIPDSDIESFSSRYKKIVRFVNFTSTEFDIECIQLWDSFPYTRVIIFDEGDLIRAASLRNLFRLSGQSLESAIAFKNKVIMKQKVSNSGIEIPSFGQITTTAEVYDFIRRNNFPIVLKPIAGAGSVNTHVIRDMNELYHVILSTDMFNRDKNEPILVESYVEGDMYHVDGLVYEGEPVIMWPSKYINNCLDFMKGKPLGDYILLPSNPMVERLCNLTKKVLCSLPTPDACGFHLEVFHTPNDKLVFCEIASRIGGAQINLSWIECLGIDLRNEFFRVQAGLAPTKNFRGIIPIQTHMNLMYPSLGKKLVRRPKSAPFPWLDSHKIIGETGKIIPLPTKSTDCFASFIFRSETEADLLEKTNIIEAWLDQEVIWETVESAITQ